MKKTVRCLAEVPSTSQYPDEPHRRWFSGHKCDLIVWDDPSGNIIGFQLCYNKFKNEHAMTWRADSGWVHNRVEYDNPTWGHGEFPVMQPDGVFDKDTVVTIFEKESHHIDQDVVAFVLAKLGEYTNP